MAICKKKRPTCETDEYGDKRWYLNGQLHREDGPACEYASGTKFWYLNGQRHREDGPAYEHVNGTKVWRLNGQLHRKDGPAIEYSNGDKYWYLKDIEYSEAEYHERLRNGNL